MRFRTILVLALALVSVSSVLNAELVDRIAAVVNEEIILLSEIDEKLFVMQAQGQLQGVDSTQVESLRREILDRLIEEKLVVQRASSQGIEPDPTMVANRTGASGNSATIRKLSARSGMSSITKHMRRSRWRRMSIMSVCRQTW